MKILLMRPPFGRLRGFAQAPVFPLGIGWIAALLKSSGHNVLLYYPENPAPGESFTVHKQGVFENRRQAHEIYLRALKNDSLQVWKEIETTIADFKPDILGISVLSTEFGSALKVSQIAKSTYPAIKIVWGGVHPTFEAESCLAHSEVDYAVRGEGEITMLELSHHLAQNKPVSRIPGLSWKENGRFVHNSDRKLLENLDILPLPARDLLVNPNAFTEDSLGVLITSRGCPWRCTFCSSRSFWQQRVRFRAPELVVDEIADLKKRFSIRSFTFWDDAFSLDRNHALNICRELIRRRLNITWRSATRLDLVDAEMLRLMRKSGCTQLEIGIESGSSRILRLICKDIQTDRIQEYINLIKRHGIACGVFFMLGFPQETYDDIQATFNLMKSISPAEQVLNIYDPLPGSALFNLAKEWNMISQNEDWIDFRLWPDRHFVRDVTPHVFNAAVEEISQFVFEYNHGYKQLFNRITPEAIHLIKRNPGRFLKKFGKRVISRLI